MAEQLSRITFVPHVHLHPPTQRSPHLNPRHFTKVNIRIAHQPLTSSTPHRQRSILPLSTYAHPLICPHHKLGCRSRGLTFSTLQSVTSSFLSRACRPSFLASTHLSLDSAPILFQPASDPIPFVPLLFQFSRDLLFTEPTLSLVVRSESNCSCRRASRLPIGILIAALLPTSSPSRPLSLLRAVLAPWLRSCR